MTDISILSGQEILDCGIAEQIIELDRLNMSAILTSAGKPFEEDKRRKGFSTDGCTCIIAQCAGTLIGYLEFCRSWDNPDEIYIASLQITPQYRGGPVLVALLDATHGTLIDQHFSRIIAGVQRNNIPAIRLYRKLGFNFEELPANPASLRVWADRDIFDHTRHLIDRLGRSRKP